MASDEDPDYLYALELQNRLNSGNGEFDSDVEEIDVKSSKVAITRRYSSDDDSLNTTKNLVHPMWETLDPTPDIKTLFGNFDGKFFQNRLKCVNLEWSKKMYSCAGICYSKSNRFGMDVTIRLSEPLLKLRPRKDLIETMLHEMIHAYCFVLNIREGNGGHGPNFKKIMYGINKVAGTNITVYHTFHDEVEVYKQHWWRCNGCCTARGPFYGYVKRTSNRAPGPYDQWWARHMSECGGTFMKIKGYDKKIPAKKDVAKKSKSSGAGDLRKFFDLTTNTESSSKKITEPVKRNGSGTIVIHPKTVPTKPSALPAIAKAFPPTSYPGLSTEPFNVNRILNKNSSPNAVMSGKGYSMTSGQTNKTSPIENSLDRERLRDIWSKRFPDGTNNSSNKKQIHNELLDMTGQAKRRRLSSENHPSTSAQARDKSESVFIVEEDDDVIILPNPKLEIIALSSDEDSVDAEPSYRQKIHSSADERQKAIKREILDESSDLRDEDIILLDDEYDDNEDILNISAAAEVADTSVIDEFFGEDTLLREFKIENAVTSTFGCDSELRRVCANPDQEIITCFICRGKMQRNQLSEHLDGCTGIAVRIPFPSHVFKKKLQVRQERETKRKTCKSSKDILRNAGYSEADLLNISSSGDEQLAGNATNLSSSRAASNYREAELYGNRRRNLYKTTNQCPACGEEYEPEDMSNHLDICSSAKRKSLKK